MSYTLPASVTALLAAIDAGVYVTPSARQAAIELAGGPDFVQLAITRQWLANSGGGSFASLTGAPSDNTALAAALISSRRPIAIKTTTYQVLATDYQIVGNHATVPFTITLISAASAYDAGTGTSLSFVFKNKGAAAMTVSAASLGQLFTTALVNTIVLQTGDSITVQSDGTSWMLN